MASSAVVPFILSLVVLLFVATAMSVLTKRVKMPLSLTLVIVGLLLGEVIRLYPSLQTLYRLQLSEEILMYVFLPTLVFHAAFAIDSRLLMKNVLPVLVLAVPAVVISFLGVGFGLFWTAPAVASLGAALLFGALITATDSTAVLTIFREIGAPKRLNILVQGENLLNDAVSIVIFTLVAAAVGVGAATIPADTNVFLYGLGEFTVAFVGGLGTGAAMAFIFGKLIEAIEDDDLIESLLTSVLAYTSFLVAEFVLGASGITAVVGAGVVLGGWGRTKFSAGTLDYLTRFWAYLAFVVNALVFLLTGLAIELGIVWSMLGAIGVAFVVTMAARALSILGLFPLVNLIPGTEPTGMRYQGAIVWGGIRGGTALALALTLPATYPEYDTVVGLTVGVVLLSLFVQGLTLEPVIRLLGLHRITPAEQYSRDEAVLRVKRAGRSRIPELRRGGVISDSVARDVERVFADEEQQVRDRIEVTRRHELVGAGEETKLLRRQMLLVEKRAYRDLFHSGVISEKVFKDLHHSIDVQIDHLRTANDLPRWTIHSPVRWRVQKALFRFIDAVLPASRVVQAFRLNRIAERYEENWARVITSGRVLAELETVRERGAFGEDVVDEATRLYRRWSENAQKRLDLIGEQFPEYAAKVQEMVALRLCLHAEDRKIVDLGQLDALSERDVMQLRREVERRIRALRRKPVEELRPYPRELLAKVPFFQGLPPEDFDRIVGLLRARTFLADEEVVRQGELGDSLFLIGRGVVRVSVRRDGETFPVATLLAGDFFGEMAVMDTAPRSATVTAATDCFLYELRRPDLETALRVTPSMRRVLEAASAERRSELEAHG